MMIYTLIFLAWNHHHDLHLLTLGKKAIETLNLTIKCVKNASIIAYGEF
jgi:hypothetical protein